MGGPCVGLPALGARFAVLTAMRTNKLGGNFPKYRVCWPHIQIYP
jgi:hypothetical protein